MSTVPVYTSASTVASAPIGGAARILRLDELFAHVNPIVIGRESDCSIHLPHPTVSLYHAILEREPDGGLVVQDLESATGVFLNGRRIRQPHAVHEGDRFGIGPFLFSRAGETLQVLDSSRSLRLEARSLGREIALPGGTRRKLLDDVNLVVRPGEFVGLLGPSGSGKSTLMDCLNGRRRATHGKVIANGQDFYEEFDSFRQSLGYVPQKDIVHTQLSVRRALFYTARLRLPTDTLSAELHARIEEVLVQMELIPHQGTMVGNLSGGQIKRVSLGAELLARPSLLYIDEATSGLDAGTEARMMRLFRRLSDEGKSIICITHAIENVDQCHLVIVLAGGKLMYYGPPEEAPSHFGVKTLSQIYDRLTNRDVGEWHADFRASRYYKEFVEDRLAESDAFAATAREASARAALSPMTLPLEASIIVDSTGLPAHPHVPSSTVAGNGNGSAAADSAGQPEPAPGLPSFRADFSEALQRRLRGMRARYRKARRVGRSIRLAVHQFRVLTNRYVELILRDPRSLRLLLLQAPVVALFLLVGFIHKPYEDMMPVARQLEPNERQILTQLNAWSVVLAEDKNLTPDQRQTLDTLQFTIIGPHVPEVLAARRIPGVPTGTDGDQGARFSGRDLHDYFNALHDPNLNPAIRASVRATVEKWQIRMDDAIPRATVTGQDLLATFDKVGKSKMAELLLQSKKPVVMMSQIVDPRFTYVLLNIVAITVFWFGCNNAAKEIVKEEAIYARERAVNLGIFPYLGSKFLVLSIMSALQTLMLVGIVYGVLWWLHLHTDPQSGHDYPPADYMLPFASQFGALALLSIVGVAAGLLLSACVSSPDRASSLLPYVLIPQIILGGAIIPVHGEPINTLASIFSPVCWGFRAVHRGAGLLPDYHPLHETADFTVMGSCTALFIQLGMMLVLTAWFLRMKDGGKR